MKHLRQKTLVLFTSVLLAIAGTLAASRRLIEPNITVGSGQPKDDRKHDNPAPIKSPEQGQQSVSPQAVGPIDRHAIAGGGGTSSGGSIKVDGTVGEVSASRTMSGGSLTLNGGFWNVMDGPPAATQDQFQFSASSYSVQEDCTTVTITVNRTGDTSGAASVNYSTSNGPATERGDYITALGRLSFASGVTSQSFVVLINEDSLVEGNETFNVNLSNPSGAVLGAPAISAVQIIDDATEPPSNTIDDPQSYVCQHYHDFLNRQPDAPGLAFWTNEITSCGSNPACIEIKRINVSASFFLSIEFQNTGYLVERLYKASYGDANGASTFPNPHQLPVPIIRFNEFLEDTSQIGQGVVVGQGNWEQQLENNKQAFTTEFVQRTRFTTAYPASMPAAQFVDTLNQRAGNPLPPSERDLLASQLSNGVKTRAQVLRTVAEHQNLSNSEFNRAFVLMQYFGYLRRNPNDPQDTDHSGYDFWLTKLNQFNGNFIDAEMVKAFITSIEYRQRFAP
jgi:Calx-beta domain